VVMAIGDLTFDTITNHTPLRAIQYEGSLSDWISG